MAMALIIDDEIDICYLLSSILRSKQMDVSYVNSLSDAYTVLEAQEPEIIFLDNHLSDGMGVDFLKQVKTKYPDAKVVMITAFDNSTDRIMAADNGADSFISKPFNKEQIYQAIERLVPQ